METDTEKIYDYESRGNDLFCTIGQCLCPEPLFAGSSIEHLKKKKIKLTGYYDDYFFNVVNSEFKIFKCKGCGVKFNYRWTLDGVLVGGMTNETN